jgi:hypothetical protein
MWIRRLRPLAIALSLVLVLGACGGGDDGFDQETRDRYMAGCMEQGNEAFCSCTLGEFEGRFTLAEFQALEDQLSNPDEAPQAFVDAVFECIELLSE